MLRTVAHSRRLAFCDIGDVGAQTLRPDVNAVKTTNSLEGPTSRC
jgi:hypothetical protein